MRLNDAICVLFEAEKTGKCRTQEKKIAIYKDIQINGNNISITITNGEKGADGERGPQGPSGKDGAIQYTAGDNITIQNNQISANLSNYALKSYVDGLIGDINTLLDTINGEVI